MAAIRKYRTQPIQHPQQQPQSPRITKRKTMRKPKRSLYTFKMLLTVCGLGIFGLMFIELYMASQINHVHYETQVLQQNIDQHLSHNEQLSAEVSILSQQSRIVEIAAQRGLTLTSNEKIITIINPIE